MNFKPTFLLICAATLSLNSISSFAQGVIFEDSFESGDMSTTNSDGFSWRPLNRTSIVTQSEDNGNVVIYNASGRADAIKDDGRNWSAFHGHNSLRFRYPAGEAWSEQRFELGGAYPEVWLSYWIRVPTNYFRATPSNNKWLVFQMVPHNSTSGFGDYSHVEMRDWPMGNDSGAMKVDIQFRNGANGNFTISDAYDNFITPADAGQWMHLVYHFKASSSNTATDGLVRMYRRWNGETEYTLINDLSNIAVGMGPASIAADTLGWTSGYLLGWANSAYAEDTEWLIDQFTVSQTPPFDIVDLPEAPSAPVLAIN